MKKIFALAAVAVLALASCSNNTLDPVNQKAREINFSTVAGKTTRAIITGNVYKTTDPHFGIFAYALAEGETWAANSGSAQLYMDNVEIKHSAADSIWCSDDTYYWPLSGSLTFIGYSPYGCNGTVAYDKANKKLTVTNFTQVAAVADQEDLMYATTNANLTDNQSTYTNENSVTSTKNGVNEVFHHSLSQVCFAVKKATGLSGYEVKVDSIKFLAYSKGTLTVTEDSPAWSDQGTELLFTAAKADSVLVDTEYRPYGDPNMPVPQTLAADTQKLIVSYSMKTTPGNVTLGHRSDTLDIRTSALTKWDDNVKYVYNIEIGLKKIYFNPTIQDWTSPATTQDITIQ